MLFRLSVWKQLRWFLVLGVVTASPWVVLADDLESVPAIPAFDQAYLPGQQPVLDKPDNHAVWVTADLRRDRVKENNCWLYQIIKQSWEPATGKTSESRIGLQSEGVGSSFATPSGILFYLPAHCADDPARLVGLAKMARLPSRKRHGVISFLNSCY